MASKCDAGKTVGCDAGHKGATLDGLRGHSFPFPVIARLDRAIQDRRRVMTVVCFAHAALVLLALDSPG